MDVLQIEQKRLEIIKALISLRDALANSEYSHFQSQVLDSLRSLQFASSPNTKYGKALQEAKARQAEGNAPFDSFEPEPKYLSDEFRPLRFICKACGLWNEELEAPNLLPNSFTEKDTFNAVPLIAPYLNKYRDALTPGLFIRFFREVSDAQIRPQIILDRWNEFLQWCKNKGYIA